jgi:hypothetical protein
MPSLSRAPSFDTSRKLVDGTLRDPKESGYVSSRPRFSRQRRIFGVTWKNLCAEDVRALDRFETLTLQGGAGAFYMPNLLVNGSFEFLGSGPQLLEGWGLAWNTGIDQFSLGYSIIPNTNDGKIAAQFTGKSGASVPVGASSSAGIFFLQSTSVPVTPGDVLAFSGMVDFFFDPLPSGVEVCTQPFFTFDGRVQIYAPVVTNSAGTHSFQEVDTTVPVPPNVSSLVVGILTWISNSSGSAFVIPPVLVVLWDSCGLASVSCAQPYGRMPGTSSPGSAVVLTKPIEIRDMPFADGEERFSAAMEVMEL